MPGYNKFALNSDYDSIKRVDEVVIDYSGGGFTMAKDTQRSYTIEANAPSGNYFETYSVKIEDSNIGKVGLTGSRVQLQHTKAAGGGYYDYSVLVQKGVTPGKYRVSLTLYNQYSYGTSVYVPNFKITVKVSLYLPASSV